MFFSPRLRRRAGAVSAAWRRPQPAGAQRLEDGLLRAAGLAVHEDPAAPFCQGEAEVCVVMRWTVHFPAVTPAGAA